MSQRRIAINLSANLGAQLFSKLFPIIAYAYAQRKIGTVAFGHALFAISLVDWSGAGIEIGSSAYGQIQVGQGSEDRPRMRSLLGGILTVRLINAVVAALILFFAVRTYYADYEHSVMALSFMMLSTVGDMAYIQVGTKSLWRLGLLNVLSKCVVLALLMLLVQDSSDATMFAVLVAGANSAVSFATFYIGVKKWRPSLPTMQQLGQLYKILLPFGVFVILTYWTERFDYFFVEAKLAPEAVGLYGGASRIYYSIQALIPALTLAFAAEMLSIRDLKAFSKQTEAALSVVFFATIPVAVGACFTAGDLLNLIYDASYRQVGYPFALLCLALVPQAIATIVGIQALITRGRIWYVNFALATAAAAGLAMESSLIVRWGLTGAALGVLLIKTLTAVLIVMGATDFIRSKRIFLLALPWLAASGLMAGALLVLGAKHLLIKLAVGGSVYGLVAAVTSYRQIRAWLAKRRQRPPKPDSLTP
ncbi:MAG: lipopolysaccharide biosynthesis protein [Proteobacteria bacterium]|nr:lipopolysaccharide biosynthesis protein [Pseudomonadota bacterium]